MPTNNQHESLIENPSAHFHYVYNMLKAKWLTEQRLTGESLKGFDRLLARVLKLERRPAAINQRKYILSGYRLTADEYIALSEYFNVPVQELVYAHRDLSDKVPS